jgi:membrane protease YdiL (CAAX protease family)
VIESKLLRMEPAADPPRDWERTVDQMEPGATGAVEPSAGPAAGGAIPGSPDTGADERAAGIGENGSSGVTGVGDIEDTVPSAAAEPVSVAPERFEQPEQIAEPSAVERPVVEPAASPRPVEQGFAAPGGPSSAFAAGGQQPPNSAAPNSAPAPAAAPSPQAQPQPQPQPVRQPQPQPQGGASYPPPYPGQYPGAVPQWGQPQPPYGAAPYQAHPQAYAHAQYMAQMQQAQAYAQAQAQYQAAANQARAPQPPMRDQPPGQAPPQPPPQQQAAVATADPASSGRPAITPKRAFLELGAVYIPAFGLGIINAIGLLVYPQLSNITQISPWFDASSDIFSYTMQALVVIFGVGYFSMRRGWTLKQMFGKPTPPDQYAAAGAGWAGYAGQPGAYPYQQYPPVRRPAQRTAGWQNSRAYFLSLFGVFLFLAAVLIFDAITHETSGAPSQGGGAWLVPDGIVTALAAGFGEEVLITGMLVTTLEQAGFGKKPWVIYLVAVCLRIPYHLYYGWAAFGVITFTLVNIWVYRRWRLLWPIVLAHATYDALQFLGELDAQLAGILIVLTALATLVMAIVIGCIELSDASARRDFTRAQAAMAGAGWPAPGYPPPQQEPAQPQVQAPGAGGSYPGWPQN